jgi:hypothetical protein
VKAKACAFYAGLCIGMILMIDSTAKASQLFFQPRLEVGVMSYSFESEAIGGAVTSVPVPLNSGFNVAQDAFEYNDNLSFIGGGGTVFSKRFFLDFSGQYAFDGHDSETISYSAYIDHPDDNVEDGYNDTAFMARNVKNETHFDRTEMAISLGYALSRQSSLFAGYKWAATKFDTTYQGISSSVNYNADDDIDGTTGSRIWGDAEFSFEYEGPFIGVIQGWDFSQSRLIKGVFTTSLALAYLHGQVTLDRRNNYLIITWIDGQQVPPDAAESVTVDDGPTYRHDTAGDSLGLTFGIAWRGLTAVHGLSYHIGISGYRYEFEAQDNAQSDINETAVIYKFGVAYAF